LPTEALSGLEQIQLNEHHPQTLRAAISGDANALNALRTAGYLKPIPLGDVALLATGQVRPFIAGNLHISSPIPPGGPHFSAFFRAWSSPS
jgi:hypothetical protein